MLKSMIVLIINFFLFCFLMVAKIKRLRELSHIDEERAICALSQFNWNIEQALQNL